MATATASARREGVDWLLYGILLAAILCLPLGIIASGWMPRAEALVPPALWGSLLAIVLARSRWPAWVCWVLGLAAGIMNAVQQATGLLPRLGLLLRELVAALGMLYAYVVHGQMPSSQPFAETVRHIVTHTQSALEAVRAWAGAVSTGQVSEDVTVLVALVVFAIWIFAWNATFQMLRNRHAMAAMLPLGIAVVSNSAVTHLGLRYVQVFVGAMLLVLAYANMTRMHAMWERYGVDFSNELRRDTLVAGAGLASLALVIALLTPYITYNPAAYSFWDRFGPRLEAFYDELDRVFAGRNPVPEMPETGTGGIALGVSPHDVGAGSRTSSRTVMLVATSDPAPPPAEELEQMASAEALDPRRFVERRYWRQRTYDIYNGNGWETSPVNMTAYGAQQPWKETLYPHTVLTQTYTLLTARGNVVFGVNEPVVVSTDYAVVTRGEGDLVALSVDEDSYTVVSHVPQPTEEELRAAEELYEPGIEERYLALPRIPERVSQLAHEVVVAAGAETRYDKARAIERYLRAYPYDLDVPPPPLDADSVEYFLFDVQRGYCDYSASAMVVMLRSVGVASRYASGFAMGTYDYVRSSWVVTGENAHAWAEVYFPGIGWIEFEPTPTQLPREFSGGSRSYNVPQIPPADVRTARRGVPWGSIGLGILAVGLVAVVGLSVSGRMPYRLRRGMEAREVVLAIYAELVRQAAWLKLHPREGQTPSEFLQAVAAALEARGTYGGSLATDIGTINLAYQRARYGSAPLSPGEAERAVMAWKRLRPHLFELMLRPGRRPSTA